MREIQWYFDFISPFSYLQSTRLASLPGAVTLAFKPVLFGGLLKHWGQLGPAEIPAKRRMTYRQVVWLAREHGIPLQFPPVHPFNPLAVLRLACALDCRPDIVHSIFRFIWADGRDLSKGEDWQVLARLLGVEDAEALIVASGARERLARNTDDAIAAGVFGVPTLAIDGELFWGFDATEMAVAYLRDADLFRKGEFARIDSLPVGVTRKR